MSDNEYESDSEKSTVVSDDENYIVDKQMKEYEKKMNGVGESSDEEYVNSEDEDDDDDDDDDNEFGFMEGVEGETAAAVVGKQTKKKKTVQPDTNADLGNEYIDYDVSSLNGDDEDDDEDDDGTEYLRKFDDSMRKSVISEHHTELFQHNMDEIEALCVTVRDKNGIIIDPLHRTLPFLTKYERARILGERAKQINAGAPPMVPVADDIIDGYLIALKELESKSIPFIIKRPLMNGGCEYWRLQDLELL
jgi:DNA-directed RNA polymerases I, II, and III subunit RPABC2